MLQLGNSPLCESMWCISR